MPLHHAIATASCRTATEDRALAIELPDRLVILIADGAGGIPCGGTAADVVVGIVRERAAALVDGEGCASLLREADRQCEPIGETTAVLLIVTEDGVMGASCGDSEAWLVSVEGAIQDLTAAQHTKRRIGSGRAAPVAFRTTWASGAALVAATDGLFRYTSGERIAETVRATPSARQTADALARLVRTANGDLLDDVAVVVVRRRIPGG